MDIESLIQPSLAEPVSSEREAIALASGNGWHLEQKLDGVRLLVHIQDGEVAGVNRKGIVIPLPSKISECFQWFQGDWVFDGELVKGVYWVFDLLRAMSAISTKDSYSARRNVLENLWPRLEMPDQVRLLPSKTDPVEKLELAASLREGRAEGVMLKDGSAPYSPGKRVRTTRKWKFYESVDCIVIEPWREGKKSMSVGLVDEHGMITDVGSVAMTPANLAKVSPGDVVECKYLYVDDPKEPRLYQPAFIRRRTDKSPDECGLDQLKFTSKEVVP